MRRYAIPCVLLLCAILTTSGCSIVGEALHSAPSPTSVPGHRCVASCAALGSASHVRIFTEPESRATPVLSAIKSAQVSVWMSMYLLTDLDVIHALEDARNRRVDVRVMLDPHPFGSSAAGQRPLIDELQASGVQAKTTPPGFSYSHAKYLLIDQTTAWVMTGNLTKSALGGSTAATNREYTVVDTEPEDVKDLSQLFLADWNRNRFTPSAPNLVISPINARIKLIALITDAKNSLMLEEEELTDPIVVAALSDAGTRGVRVQLLLPSASSSGSASSEAANVRAIAAAGGVVHRSTGYYIHAKLILADGSLAFAGSENISASSLDENREVGLFVGDPSAIVIFTSTFQADWAQSISA